MKLFFICIDFGLCHTITILKMKLAKGKVTPNQAEIELERIVNQKFEERRRKLQEIWEA